MTDQFTPLAPISGFSADQAFADDVASLLQQLEGTEPSPYTDINGIPTVGIGINLQVSAFADAYFKTAGITISAEQALLKTTVFNKKYKTNDAFQTALSNALQTNGYAALPALSNDQIESLYQQVVIGDSNGLDPSGKPAMLPAFKTYMAAHGVSSDLLASQSGLALFSMYFNNKGTLLPPSGHLLHDLNANALNRADAWFQIRYGSNGGSSASGGIAKRRYEESQIFGLYNAADGTGAVSLDEATAIYAELSASTAKAGQTNRQWALSYENTYSNYIAKGSADLGALTPMVSGETVQIEGMTVQTLEQSLQPAADALNASLNDTLENPYYSGTAAFGPLDIQVAAKGGGNDLVASYRDGYNLAPGANDTNAQYDNSLLIAQDGNDTLDGSGTANDALIGGTGNDTFYVGSGNDYIVAGSGNALIEGGTNGGAIGSGNDTIVLGEANAPWKGGDDTVWGGSGNDVYYLGVQSQTSHIHLGSGHSTINVVHSPTDTAALAIDAVGLVSDPFNAASLGESLYQDHTHHELVLSTLNPDGTKRLEIFDLPPLVANSNGQVPRAQRMDVTAGTGATETDGELIIDGYTGSNLSGIQLTDGPTQTIQASNLSQLEESNGNVYDDTNGVDSVYGSDTSGSSSGNVIDGQGNAPYIYAGNGNNDVFTGEAIDSATTAWSKAFDVTVQGGSGNQILVGFGNSNETILGGDVGQDTTAWDVIDGGGGNGLLEGGTQNSVIYGGTGQDTLIAGSGSASGYNPKSYLIAGVSFWNGGGDAGSEPSLSIPGGTAANFQITLSNAANQTINLLGSYLDPAVASASSMPGSLLIGGTGSDALIGNQGNDTLIGGTPLHSQSGIADETLVGGAGADLIYGGDGNEWIYADMPASVAGWADDDPNNADTIYGGSGNDVIYGSGGNDEIYGGSGSYSIYVGDGNSYVDSGSGTAIVYGGSGADTLIADGSVDQIYSGTGNALIEAEGAQATITLQGGNDTVDLDAGNTSIIEGNGTTTLVTGLSAGSSTIQTGSQATRIQLAAGLSDADVSVSNVNGDLVISDADTGGQITVSGYFANSDSNISLQFADGTVWGTSQIQTQSAITINGTTGNDSLTGTSSAEIFDGEGGDDYVSGGGGSDTFIFNAGYGHLTISEGYSNGQQPVLQFGEGITASMLKVTTDGDSVFISDGVSGDEISLNYMWWKTELGDNDGVALVQFADGTSLTATQLNQLELSNGTTGNDTLYATGGSDLIDGKGGNDVEISDGGNDTFVFNAGYGQLMIQGSAWSGHYSAVLQLGEGITSSMLHVTTDGGDLFLTDGISGDRIDIFNGWTRVDGNPSVQLADGTVLSHAQLVQMELSGGTAGSDSIYGTSDADLIDGKGGNDTVYGDGGSDTFVFKSGYGHLDIKESYTSGQTPVLQLGDGITSSNLKVVASADGTGLILTDGTSGDQITLENALSNNGNYGVAAVNFVDGTTLTAAQLVTLSHQLMGTTGADTITGTAGADLIDGKGGNDSVIGGGGNDTFVFNSGYGHLEVNEAYTSGQAPVLQLGTGISKAALRVTTNGTDVILTDGTSGDQVTLDKMWSSGSNGVASVQLSDGTVLTRAQLLKMEMTGTVGADTLYGTSGADLIDGKGGNDSVVGKGGNDTFVFNSGYAHLEINETYTSGQAPVLQLGTGISKAALRVTTNGTDLVLTDGTSGDQVTLDKMWSSGSNGVASVKLSDGTVLTRAQLLQMEMTGTNASDKLYGTSGADVLDGKGGSDTVTGGGGSDTFVFNSGYGHLVINETYTSGQSPVLQLGAGITASALKVVKSGSNLVLTDGVTGDQITLNNMASSSTSGVAVVKFANGTSLTRAQLIQMVPAASAPHLAQTAAFDSGVSTQINSLIHAMAGYTGYQGEGVSIHSTLAPSVDYDRMLHAGIA